MLLLKVGIVQFYITELNCGTTGGAGAIADTTPLHLAAKNGHLHRVKYLIEEQHCNPSCQDESNITPIILH